MNLNPHFPYFVDRFLVALSTGYLNIMPLRNFVKTSAVQAIVYIGRKCNIIGFFYTFLFRVGYNSIHKISIVHNNALSD